MSIGPGTTLGPYEILSLLGEGGMGSVWKARDPRLGRYVAIKVAKEKFNERFDREARAVAALNHPNICTLYDIGPNYLVMEYIEGPTLTARIGKEGMPLEEAMPILRQLIDGIEAAHEKGIYHRDLKPDNIKITPEGTVKVLDFGLAKAADPLQDLHDPANAPTIRLASLAGVIMGTPSYMSPEQASGQPVDKRADVWSFGVVLWEMLTGKRLFDGQTIAHTLADVINKEIRVDDAPAKVQPLLRRCLVRDARKRMRDIGEARIALDKIESGEEEVATALPPAPPQRKWPIPAFATSAVLAAALGVGWWLNTRPVEKPLLWLQTDLGDLSRDTGMALSRDGSKIVFTSADADKKVKLFLRYLDREAAVPISGTEEAQYPFLSPDGQWVAFFAGGKLKKVSIEGGVAVSLCDVSQGRGGSWGEDGFIVAALGLNSGLVRIPENGGAPVALTELRKDERAHRFPQHLPGGKGILFMSVEAGTDYNKAIIEVFSLSDKKRTVLHRGGMYPRYLAGGHVAYVFEGALFGMPFRLDRLEAGGSPIQLLSGVRPGLAGNAFIDVSPNGTAVFVKGLGLLPGQGLVIQWVDASGKTEPLVAQPGASNPNLSPDGTKVAFQKDDNIWIHDWRRDVTTKLTFEGLNGFPVFSSDGKHIAYTSIRKELFLIRADGGGKPVRLLESGAVAPSSFSSDGRRLFYWDGASGSPNNISYVLPLEVGEVPTAREVPQAGKPQQVLEPGAQDPNISPDGKWLAYRKNGAQGAHIFVRSYPASGGKWQVSGVEQGLNPIWASKGRQLFYRGFDGRVRVVDYTTKGDSFESGKPRIWTEAPSVMTFSNMSLLPDGKRMAMVGSPASAATDAADPAFVMVNFLDEVRRKMRTK
ncbi:MAG: serine/threonine-protein kinase [Candidatus Solibacter usitatus]|nr:serine/threonine-protein kinase [Candidatus Solibacter usitatus]